MKKQTIYIAAGAALLLVYFIKNKKPKELPLIEAQLQPLNEQNYSGYGAIFEALTNN